MKVPSPTSNEPPPRLKLTAVSEISPIAGLAPVDNAPVRVKVPVKSADRASVSALIRISPPGLLTVPITAMPSVAFRVISSRPPLVVIVVKVGMPDWASWVKVIGAPVVVRLVTLKSLPLLLFRLTAPPVVSALMLLATRSSSAILPIPVPAFRSMRKAVISVVVSAASSLMAPVALIMTMSFTVSLLMPLDAMVISAPRPPVLLIVIFPLVVDTSSTSRD